MTVATASFTQVTASEAKASTALDTPLEEYARRLRAELRLVESELATNTAARP